MPTYQYEMTRNSFLNGFEDLIDDISTADIDLDIDESFMLEATSFLKRLSKHESSDSKKEEKSKLDNNLPTSLFCSF